MMARSIPAENVISNTKGVALADQPLAAHDLLVRSQASYHQGLFLRCFCTACYPGIVDRAWALNKVAQESLGEIREHSTEVLT